VLTHFSQRYEDPTPFADEAAAHFDGDIVIAEDLARIPMRRDGGVVSGRGGA
jgi:ribonuclease Z